MSEPIAKADLVSAMMSFLRSIDPHACLHYKCCQARVGGTLITANLGECY